MEDELVLVVTRPELFNQDKDYFTGVVPTTNYPKILRRISVYGYFKGRKFVETNPGFQQIIPYILIKHKDEFFMYKRLPKANEARLHDKFSLGIGGHINPSDAEGSKSVLESAAKREFEEEINYQGNWNLKLLGFLNLDETPVDKVHFGVVYVIEIENKNIEIKEKHKIEGMKFFSIHELEAHKEDMEDWYKIVFDWLKQSS